MYMFDVFWSWTSTDCAWLLLLQVFLIRARVDVPYSGDADSAMVVCMKSGKKGRCDREDPFRWCRVFETRRPTTVHRTREFSFIPYLR